MKIGIFDSGVGGLIIAKAIRQTMPEYDYVYLGDTKRVPYGSRSHETVFEFTKQGVDYLFKKEDCAIVIIACNTASARALRRIQQEYLPVYNESRSILGESKRNVIGVLIPTAEECAKYKKVGIIGTTGTIASNTFPNEIKKILALRNLGEGGNKKTQIFQNPAPMLVPLAEEGEKVLAKPFLIKYLKPLLVKKPEAIALGCTHYPFFKNEIKKIILAQRSLGGVGAKNIKIISQDEIIPKKLKDYFARHPEIEKKLSKGKKARILVTDVTKNIEKLTRLWFGKTKPEFVKL
ncbi:MAG: glutamate racemase [bacterium]